MNYPKIYQTVKCFKDQVIQQFNDPINFSYVRPIKVWKLLVKPTLSVENSSSIIERKLIVVNLWDNMSHYLLEYSPLV